MSSFNCDLDLNDLLATPLTSAASVPRWKRKQEALASSSGDRFISNRRSYDVEASCLALSNENSQNGDSTPIKEAYKSRVSEEIVGSSTARVLAFKSKAPAPREGYYNDLRVLYSGNRTVAPRTQSRHISSRPVRVLDAPGLSDDFYVNVLDWSVNNHVAVALADQVYIWNSESGEIAPLTAAAGNAPTSLSFSADGAFLAIGTTQGSIEVWDMSSRRKMRTLRGHSDGVTALSWNSFVLASGARDGEIISWDVRQRNAMVARFQAHSSEVCGLKWSPNGSQIASGGNDNIVNVYNSDSFGSGVPTHVLSYHCSAVKALAWCPWEANILATGGGLADRHIRFWNTQTGACINEVDTKSQVCSLLWSRHSRELVSGHGQNLNQITVWKFPSMEKVTELKSHTQRVLHLALSPDGTSVMSAAGDESLRLWKVFEPAACNTTSAGKPKQAHVGHGLR